MAATDPIMVVRLKFTEDAEATLVGIAAKIDTFGDQIDAYDERSDMLAARLAELEEGRRIATDTLAHIAGSIDSIARSVADEAKLRGALEDRMEAIGKVVNGDPVRAEKSLTEWVTEIRDVLLRRADDLAERLEAVENDTPMVTLNMVNALGDRMTALERKLTGYVEGLNKLAAVDDVNRELVGIDQGLDSLGEKLDRWIDFGTITRNMVVNTTQILNGEGDPGGAVLARFGHEMRQLEARFEQSEARLDAKLNEVIRHGEQRDKCLTDLHHQIRNVASARRDELGDLRADINAANQDIARVGDRLDDHLSAYRPEGAHYPTLVPPAHRDSAIEERIGHIEMRLDSVESVIVNDQAADSCADDGSRLEYEHRDSGTGDYTLTVHHPAPYSLDLPSFSIHFTGKVADDRFLDRLRDLCDEAIGKGRSAEDDARSDMFDQHIANIEEAGQALGEHVAEVVNPLWRQTTGFDHKYLSEAVDKAVTDFGRELTRRIKRIAHTADLDEVPF